MDLKTHPYFATSMASSAHRASELLFKSCSQSISVRIKFYQLMVFLVIVLSSNARRTSSRTTTTHEMKNTTMNYKSSDEEHQWLSGVRGRICKIANENRQLRAAEIWVNYSSGIFRSKKTSYPQPTERACQVLSSFNSGNGAEYIEPLHGYLRHPQFGICMNNTNKKFENKFNISHLIISNNCDRSKYSHANQNRRNIFFDLGASVGFKGIKHGISRIASNSGSGIGPSIPLFYSMYADKCIEFDDVFAWEVHKYSPQEWWGELPPKLRAKVRFYNVPVEENFGRGKIKRNSFLHLLKSYTMQEDFVVIKVDMDTPKMESRIVKAIADDKFLSRLVDEIFFEYHVYMDGLQFGWRINSTTTDDVDDALQLMHRLRKLGIRSHFWI